MPGTTNDLINYRLERAKETLLDAKLLADVAIASCQHAIPGLVNIDETGAVQVSGFLLGVIFRLGG